MSIPEDNDALAEASGIVYLPEGQLYELNIVATGEVRDKDGNLISSEPIEAKAVVNEEQLSSFLRQPLIDIDEE